MRAFIGLGGNLPGTRDALGRAIAELNGIGSVVTGLLAVRIGPP